MLRARESDLNRRWEGPLNVRFAAVRGTALVGFIGRGSMKSFTAVGESVSFTHRLAGAVEPWSLGYYDSLGVDSRAVKMLDFEHHIRTVSGLKGFGSDEFKISICKVYDRTVPEVDYGRCDICSTPMTLDEDPMGMPKISCPGCLARAPVLQAA